MDIQTLQWDEQGLIPAIVQDEETGDVLMLAYMNEESLQKTIETKETWFYSRSRQELWNKGATSGNRQYVKKIDVDCDKDTLLLTVSTAGPACHTGERSCFFTNAFDEGEHLRTVVYEIRDEIRYRKQHPKEGSYTTYLLTEGVDKILKKVGEEATEVVIGAKNRDKENVAMEISDLIYHTLVLMEEQGVEIENIQRVLRSRRRVEGEDANE